MSLPKKPSVDSICATRRLSKVFNIFSDKKVIFILREIRDYEWFHFLYRLCIILINTLYLK